MTGGGGHILYGQPLISRHIGVTFRISWWGDISCLITTKEQRFIQDIFSRMADFSYVMALESKFTLHY